MPLNSWPGGKRRAISQGAHEKWNAIHYPGTRQICVTCNEPTENCEEDALYPEETGPLCPDCYEKSNTNK